MYAVEVAVLYHFAVPVAVAVNTAAFPEHIDADVTAGAAGGPVHEVVQLATDSKPVFTTDPSEKKRKVNAPVAFVAVIAGGNAVY